MVSSKNHLRNVCFYSMRLLFAYRLIPLLLLLRSRLRPKGQYHPGTIILSWFRGSPFLQENSACDDSVVDSLYMSRHLVIKSCVCLCGRPSHRKWQVNDRIAQSTFDGYHLMCVFVWQVPVDDQITYSTTARNQFECVFMWKAFLPQVASWWPDCPEWNLYQSTCVYVKGRLSDPE